MKTTQIPEVLPAACLVSNFSTYFGFGRRALPSEAPRSHHEHGELVVADQLLAAVRVHCGAEAA